MHWRIWRCLETVFHQIACWIENLSDVCGRRAQEALMERFEKGFKDSGKKIE
jgi:hypothetical protein